MQMTVAALLLCAAASLSTQPVLQRSSGALQPPPPPPPPPPPLLPLSALASQLRALQDSKAALSHMLRGYSRADASGAVRATFVAGRAQLRARAVRDLNRDVASFVDNEVGAWRDRRGGAVAASRFVDFETLWRERWQRQRQRLTETNRSANRSVSRSTPRLLGGARAVLRVRGASPRDVTRALDRIEACLIDAVGAQLRGAHASARLAVAAVALDHRSHHDDDGDNDDNDDDRVRTLYARSPNPHEPLEIAEYLRTRGGRGRDRGRRAGASALTGTEVAPAPRRATELRLAVRVAAAPDADADAVRGVRPSDEQLRRALGAALRVESGRAVAWGCRGVPPRLRLTLDTQA